MCPTLPPPCVSLSVCLFVGCCTLVVKQVEVEDEDEVGSGGAATTASAAEPVKPAKLQKLVLPASGVTAKSPVPKQFRYMGREVTKFFPEATTLAGLAHLDDKYVVRAFLDFCRSKSNGESYARVFQVGDGCRLLHRRGCVWVRLGVAADELCPVCVHVRGVCALAGRAHTRPGAVCSGAYLTDLCHCGLRYSCSVMLVSLCMFVAMLVCLCMFVVLLCDRP